MKIGVITYSTSEENYGQILQCYAMQETLKGLGHEPFLIRYQPNVPKQAGFRMSNIFNYILKLPKYIRFYLNQKAENRRCENAKAKSQNIDRKFSEFLKSSMSLTELYDSASILENPPIADAYICGSDQIWGNDDAFFLNFAPKGSLKIAYAPSFGGNMPSEEEEDKIKMFLKDYKYIGIREQSGVELCHRLGYSNAEKVVDPTFLLNMSDYDKISVTSDSSNYILVYLLGNSTKCTIDEIYNFAKKKNKDVIYIPSQGRDDDYPKVYPTIGEFLGLIKGADMVITNSFHCTVFSLTYHKPFVTLLLNKGYARMNGRVEELLSESKLTSRIWRGDFQDIPFNNICFDEFDRYKSSEQARSLAILKKNLT